MWEANKPLSITREIVLFESDFKLNEETGAQTMDLTTGSELPAFRLLCTNMLSPEIHGDKLDDAEAEDPVQREPVLSETGRKLKISTFSIMQTEEENNSNHENEGNSVITKRVPICILIPSNELESMSEGSKSQIDSQELNGDCSSEDKTGVSNDIYVECDGGYAAFSGYSIRSDIPEGTYELVISNGNEFDETSTQILGSLNIICLELCVKQGTEARRAKKKKITSDDFFLIPICAHTKYFMKTNS